MPRIGGVEICFVVLGSLRLHSSVVDPGRWQVGGILSHHWSLIQGAAAPRAAADESGPVLFTSHVVM